MATNTAAPSGLLYNRNLKASSPTYQANVYNMLGTYATKIGLGDVVATGTSGNLGYVVLAADNASSILGVFAGCLPYYDLNLQTTVFTQWWTGTQNPSSSPQVLVIDDPTISFRAQAVGGTYVQGWRGYNVNWTAGTNGAPNISGISTLSLDGTSPATTNTFPFRIIGTTGVAGGPQDPTAANPWLEVVLNPAVSEYNQALGI